MLELSELKSILKIDEDDVESDTILQSIIDSSIPTMENYTGNKIAAVDLTEKKRGSASKFIAVDYYPIISLTSVLKDDTNITDEISIEEDGKTGILYSSDWFYVMYTYTIKYRAGYEILPSDIQYAQKLLCQHMYYHFDKIKSGVDSVVTPDGSFIYNNNLLPNQVKQLLEQYKKPWL